MSSQPMEKSSSSDGTGVFTPASSTAATIPTDLKKAKTLFGKCTVQGLNKGYVCTCKMGTAESFVSAIDPDASCTECHHSLSMHLEYTENPAKEQAAMLALSPQPDIHKGPEICPRIDTLLGIAQELDTKHVVYVQGSPVSGKTTLALLLRDFLRQTRKVIFVKGWKRNCSSLNYLIQAAYAQGLSQDEVHGDLQSDHNSGLVFILDDAHETCGDFDFWAEIVDARFGKQHGPRFCLFFAHESLRTGSLEARFSRPQPVFKPSRTVTLLPYWPSSMYSVFYTQSELQDVVKKYSATTGCPDLSQKGRECLMALTDGHPGMVDALLAYIRQYAGRDFQQYINNDMLSPPTDEFREFLSSNDALEFIRYQPAGKSLPSKYMTNGILTQPMIDILLRVLRQGNIRFNHKDPDLKLCVKYGFLYTFLDFANKVFCVLPSNLHARFLEYEHSGISEPSFQGVGGGPEIREFCIRVLQSLPPESLQNTFASRRGPAGRVRARADLFQDEFYQSCWSHNIFGGAVTRDWTRTASPRTAVEVPAVGWRIELLHGYGASFDLRAIARECADLVARGKVRYWVVLLCAGEEARLQGSCENLLHVVFKDDFAKFTVKASGARLEFNLGQL
ncbi:uncharacterized protein BO95DRAFT_483613 [Aspergillus brunneoviolaceus CBS 621.78]|uniref:Uncharacterized protein n=1 Tax=Aspergillus brunneoviolaceus CBS 621.78 TaxID=1450534 RepID=A0ACD1G3Z9_9EURO|nr:hypothetical protein BO95DRAFT_483613 [Aspergillus brunneoviolaceus CBS 621.78]RAH43894.1 hypothetical protein BO95DRAFT_483613 [Aspergillus brunneoviolaceus CBS 621.78]